MDGEERVEGTRKRKGDGEECVRGICSKGSGEIDAPMTTMSAV